MATTPYDLAVLATPGVVGYWPLDETSGTTAADRVAANNGTITNGPTLGVALGGFAAGDVGMTFAAASSQYIASIANSAAYQFGLGDYSMSCVIYYGADPSTDDFVISRGAYSANGYELYIGGTGAYATSRAGNVVGQYAQTAFPAWTNGGGTAHHLIVAHRRNTVGQFFVDGEISGPGRNVSGEKSRVVSENAVMEIARRPSGNYFTATLAKVALFNRALDGADARRLYNARTLVNATVPSISVGRTPLWPQR